MPYSDSSNDGLHTLGRWTADRALATPNRVAVDDRGVVVSYAELEARARLQRGVVDLAGEAHATAAERRGDRLGAGAQSYLGDCIESRDRLREGREDRKTGLCRRAVDSRVGSRTNRHTQRRAR